MYPERDIKTPHGSALAPDTDGGAGAQEQQELRDGIRGLDVDRGRGQGVDVPLVVAGDPTHER